MDNAAEKLYLARRVDVIGVHQNRSKFAELVIENAKKQPTDGPWQQVSTWVLIGMTGRWQSVLHISEWANGWDGFSDMIEHTMISPPPALGGLYGGIDDLRSGGEDWVMAPGPDCPSRADLLAAGVSGSLMSWETARVEPGAEEEYMEAIATTWAPVAKTLGHTLVGNYRPVFIDGLVFTAWVTERDGQIAMARAQERRDWRREARRWTQSWQEELWISAPGAFLAGPETTIEF